MTMASMKNYLLRHAQNCIGSLGNMTRQPVASAMTIAVIGIALAMPSGLNVLVRNGQAVAGGWESIRDFSIYLKPGSSLENASQLREQILQLNIVETARLISAEQALTQLRNDSAFSEVLGHWTTTRYRIPSSFVQILRQHLAHSRSFKRNSARDRMSTW
jgi:cell division transport system permease protein